MEFYDFVWNDAMARKKAIKQYKGKLSPEKVAAEMNAAARNAKRLLDDANLLFASKRYPGACSLAILAIEEAGKLTQLRGIAIAPDERLLKNAWRDYRDHLAKNAHWIIIQLVAQGARTLDDLHPIFGIKTATIQRSWIVSSKSRFIRTVVATLIGLSRMQLSTSNSPK